MKNHFSTHTILVPIPLQYTYHFRIHSIAVHISIVPFQYTYHFSAHSIAVHVSFQYTYNPETGEWKHRKQQVFKDRKWIGYISYKAGTMTYQGGESANVEDTPKTYNVCIVKSPGVVSKKILFLELFLRILEFSKNNASF